MQRIAVLSHIVVDEIHRPDGAAPTVEVGGAGAYAATGASLAGASLAGTRGSRGASVLVAGIGSDDRAMLTDWCAAREIDPAGLFDVGESSPRTHIHYFADGERVETPVFGLEHFHAHTPLPRHIPYPPDEIAGVYLFHDEEEDYWREIAAHRPLTSAPMLWEISLDACRPQARPAVFAALELVDVLSINRTEALALLGVTDVGDAVRELRGAGALVVLRMGAEGSVVIDGDRAPVRIGVTDAPVVDPTGGGNSYSGAFLAEYARTGDAVAAARVAAAVAAGVIAQHGAPVVDGAARRRVRDAASGIRTAPA
ncbi:carbohydrate kinase family protein [Herbiconiux sp. P17]|uniref:carbohydrate kinase family protein n=1 Tax=Herbiconiux wuyangfengii TaxID=3342794 RepID=UPI0035BA4687